MAKQTIGIGTVANDRTGDPIRTAMDKINDNFTELYDVANPTPTAENDFAVASAGLAWVKKTLAQVKTILGLGSAAYTNTNAYAAASHNQAATTITPDAVQAAPFASPLALDATTHKDFKCASVTGATEVDLTNAVDGDAGLIELIIDAVGGYAVTLGAMFTKNSGGGTIDTAANADNIIAWYKSGTDIIFSISQIS
jgi:hypothetical protein